MPEHFPFRKPSGKKTNRSQGPRTALTDGFIRKQNLPPGCQREPEGFSSGPLPTCSRETTSNYKAPSCKSASDAGCGEAERGCRCSQLLASPSARGDARFRPAIRINHSATWCCQNYLGWLTRVVHFNDSCSAAGRKHQVTAAAAVSS